ncbi:MAG: ABC transporter permease [Anaerolineae bacterium]|nr:ABC transporter permease [Anaerolineae bacterium]
MRRYGTLIGFLLVVAIFWWQKPQTFMTIPNWVNITRQVSILGVVAFAMTVVMVTGDFDLSVGSMASLAGIIAGLLFQQEQSLLVAVIAALMVGLVGGLINGILVSYIGISAFVATLGMLTVFRGLALYMSGGASIYGRAIPETFSNFGRGGFELGTLNEQRVFLPNLTILAAIIFIVVLILLGQTVLGRRLYAIGGNMEAARLGGVRVNPLRLLTFVFSGVGASIAGLMLFSRLSTAHPTQGEGLMLKAIAAVFLGMTMTEEGEPHVLGTLLGVLILGVLANGLTQLRIDTYIQEISTGVIIVLAVALSSLSHKQINILKPIQQFFRNSGSQAEARQLND